jgi:hypothetical protein
VTDAPRFLFWRAGGGATRHYDTGRKQLDGSLFEAIIDKLGSPIRTNRGGNGYVEYWYPCPYCDEKRPEKAEHFSVSERGFRCFRCGEEGGVWRLGQHLGVVGDGQMADSLSPRFTPPPCQPLPPVREWQKSPRFLERFLTLPEHAREAYHARGFTDETIRFFRLGYGTLPDSRTRHPRLVLPVFERGIGVDGRPDGSLVALRGRRIEEGDEDAKWLCSAGSQTVLYGAETIRKGCPLLITEAPFSVIQVRQALGLDRRPNIGVVASTAGAGCFKAEWYDRIAEAKPCRVVVAFDHDDPGYVNASKVANKLRDLGLNASVHQWPGDKPKGYDLDEWVKEGNALPIWVPAVLTPWGRRYA